MRTAEEILKDNLKIKDTDHYQLNTNGRIINAINQARKEAIEECAERAKTKEDYVASKYVNVIIDKESILSLIKELQ